MSLETVTDPIIEKQGWVLCSDAARRIGKTVQTIYKWIDVGKVSGTCIGGYRKYVRWDDVLDHLGPIESKALGLTRTSEFKG